MLTLASIFSASRVLQEILNKKVSISLSYKLLSLANEMNEDLKIIDKLKTDFLNNEDEESEIRFIDFLNNEISNREYKKISFKDLEKEDLKISPIELKFLLPFLEEN